MSTANTGAEKLSADQVADIFANHDYDAIDALLDGKLDYDEDAEPVELEVDDTELEEEAENNTDEYGATSGAEAELEEVIESEGESEDTTPVILAKDGKHVISFDVLKGTRVSLQQANQRIAELEAKLAAESTQSRRDNSRYDEAVEQVEIGEDDLAEIDELDPAIGRVMRATARQMAELKAQNQQLRAANSQAQQAPQAEVVTAEAIQDAIDSVPDLLEWQAVNPEMFGKAVQVESWLRQDPEFRALPLPKQYAIVAQKTKSLSAIPSVAKPSQVDPEQVRAQTRQQIATAKSQTTAPRSLNSLGKSPTTNDTPEARFAKMNAAERVNYMQSLSDNEVDAFLARFNF